MRKIILILFVFIGTLFSYGQKINEVNHFAFDTIRWEKMADKVYRKYKYGSSMMVAYLKLEKGAIVPLHKHPNEQITHILSGKVAVSIGDKTYNVGKGDVLIIPANVPHRFVALEETLDMDIFSPIRMDWINNNANYFKQDK